MDTANGYETHAAHFIASRGRDSRGIGAAAVRRWAEQLPTHAAALDVGCGTGWPISKALTDAGLTVYGLDASPSMVQAFQQNFPNSPVACESVEESAFFHLQFDAIVAWGLVFLLPEASQRIVIGKMADALSPGGRLLFTSPSQQVEWDDVLTSARSVSLGAEAYRALLAASGLSVVAEFEDEGKNYYYDAVKASSSS